MTIRVTCAKCGSHLKIKDELAGKHGHCPKCKADLVIPALPEESTPAVTVVPPKAPGSDASLHESDADASAVGDAATNGQEAHPVEPVEELVAAGRETVSAAAADEDTAVSVPLSLEPDDDLDEAPALIGTPLPPTKPKPKPKPKSDDFDPAEFLMEDAPAPTKKAPVRGAGRSGPNLDLIEEYAQAERSDPVMESRLTPSPPTKSSSAAADAWDHAKAAKQMMKAIKQSNAEELKTRDEQGGESFDFVGAFKELGVKGIGGLAVVLVGAIGLYYLSNMVMGGGPKLPPLGYVTGTVTLDGKPLEGATVFFAPHVTDAASDKRPMRASHGQTDSSGFYRMYYIDKHQGVAVGQARVWLTLLGPNGRDVIPGTYSEGAAQMRDIKSGSQTINFELTTKP